jgi:NADP-dependent 3-hydroxy acid dehydrogenase YdfG
MSNTHLDKRAAVYGASSGMGRETALALARAGADVAVLARDFAALTAVAADIETLGRRAVPVAVDVQDAKAARGSVSNIVDALGGIDILVYATGWNIPKRALEVLSASDWELMQRTNLWGLYDVTQAALPTLRECDARLVVISSAAVKIPDVSGVAYQSTKHAEAGFVYGLMHEEAGNGVRATVLFPGLTETPMLGRRPSPTPPEIVAQALQPVDVADAVMFVTSLPSRAYVPELMLLPAAIQQR